MNILIIGAGVGGLSLALSLYEQGFRKVTIFEAAEDVNELGVGINILPHATKILKKYGILETLVKGSVSTSDLNYYSKLGQLIWKENRGETADYSTPQLSIHRGVLINTLYKEVIKKFGPDVIKVSSRFEHFYHTKEGKVTADFGDYHVTGDVLIGCDGIHSAVRKNLYPNEGSPNWSGITMWRGVTYMKPVLGERSMIIAGRSDHRMVVYPISAPNPKTGEVLMNWVAKYQTNDAQPMPKQDWIHKSCKDDIPKTFLKFDFLRTDEMFNNAKAIYKYPQADRDPLPSWQFGRVTLLGDAAHPMYPSGSNGASQAVIDAHELAYNLRHCKNVEDAIESYDLKRRNETAQIVYANRQAGPERCIDVVEELAPNGFEALEQVIPLQQIAQITNSYKKLAGFMPDKQPSQLTKDEVLI